MKTCFLRSNELLLSPEYLKKRDMQTYFDGKAARAEIGVECVVRARGDFGRVGYAVGAVLNCSDWDCRLRILE